jgi:histone acetyltransferase (RNA polymerase elongator complex component)
LQPLDLFIHMKKASLRSIQFGHPEPQKNRNPVWPVFIPFAGCPFRCVYCSQYAQTGQAAVTRRETAAQMTSGIMARHRKTGRPVSLGFFGGTFTAMNREDMISLLKQACFLKRKGAVDHIRCSTRPDFISLEILDILKSLHLDMIELGIQSFDHHTLKSSGRGYSGARAILACRMVRDHGFELGVQLLPGLPGSKPSGFAQDISTTMGIMPDIVRIYPCLVLKDTPLARSMIQGHYLPWDLETAVSVIAPGLLNLWLKKIPVIRLGLAPEPELMANILAGPWHPALGSLCRSAALREYFLSRLKNIPSTPCMINIPERYASDFWGHKKMNAPYYAQNGITREMVMSWKEQSFRIYFS